MGSSQTKITGRPLPLLILDDDGRLRTDESTLNATFNHPDVKDTLVAVYSLAGANRSDIATVLHLFRGYLTYQGAADWFDRLLKEFSSVEDLHKFTASLMDDDSAGIYIWNTPLFVQYPAEEKMAVFLLFTRGILDLSCPLEDSAVILSALSVISSVTYLNLIHPVSDDDLAAFKMCARCGVKAAHGQGGLPSFQKMSLLFHGGEKDKTLDYLLSSVESSREVKSCLRESYTSSTHDTLPRWDTKTKDPAQKRRDLDAFKERADLLAKSQLGLLTLSPCRVGRANSMTGSDMVPIITAISAMMRNRYELGVLKGVPTDPPPSPKRPAVGSTPNAGQALQLFSLNREGGIDVDPVTISATFLRPDVKDIPVAVYAVAGESRTGKSTILHIFKGCLAKKGNNDWLNSLLKANEPNFRFRKGTKRDTEGVLIWSEPFFITTPVAGRVALFLIDSQGVYDELTEPQESAVLFATTLLISSFTVFNIPRRISENVLVSLKCFLDYALAFSGSQEDSLKFQRLMFLIRDWQNPEDYEFGSKGGQQYLSYLFNSPDIPADQRTLRQQIQANFEGISSFLLPNPGEKMVTTDELLRAHPSFIQQIKLLAETMFHEENIEIKTFDQTTWIRGVQMATLAVTISSAFSSKYSIAEFAINPFTAHDELVLNRIKEESLRRFRCNVESHFRGKGKTLNKSSVTTTLQQFGDEAMAHFDSRCGKLGSEARTRLRQQLSNEVTAEVERYTKAYALGGFEQLMIVASAATVVTGLASMFVSVLALKAAFAYGAVSAARGAAVAGEAANMVAAYSKQQIVKRVLDSSAKIVTNVTKIGHGVTSMMKSMGLNGEDQSKEGEKASATGGEGETPVVTKTDHTAPEDVKYPTRIVAIANTVNVATAWQQITGNLKRAPRGPERADSWIQVDPRLIETLKEMVQ